MTTVEQSVPTASRSSPARSAQGRHSVRSLSVLPAYAWLIDVGGAATAIACVRVAAGVLPAMSLVLAAVALLFAWTISGVYGRALAADPGGLARRFAVATAAAVAFLIAVKALVAGPGYWTAAEVGGVSTIIAIAAAGHLLLAALGARWRADGAFSRLVVVVGATPAAARYVEAARRNGDRVVGVFAADGAVGTTFADVPVIGTYADIPTHPVLSHVDRVAVANFEMSDSDRSPVADMLRRLRSFPAEVDLAIESSFGAPPEAPGVPVLVRPISGGQALVKAAFDRVAAAALLVLLSPVMALVAIAVRLDSPGPVFFRQPRPGMGDATIEVFKFRTMRTVDPLGRVETADGDPRITRTGRFLRKFRLDELPQLINVARGEMSLVGPRPLPPLAALDHGVMGDILREHARRRSVKPGITGWAQVNGHMGPCRTADSLRRRIEFDLHYIDHWSLWLDMKILWRTIVVLAGKGGGNG